MARRCRHSQKYFDYLIERARALFPSRTPEGKVKALNYLLPHIQRVPSRIVRDEWANEISHRLGIESAVLRQELRHAAGARSASRVNAPACRGADRCRAGADPGAGQPGVVAQSGEQSRRSGPRLRAGAAGALCADAERLHAGSAAESSDRCAAARRRSRDSIRCRFRWRRTTRSLLATVLMDEHEELTPELLESSIRSLRRRVFRRQLDDLQHQLKEAERRQDSASAARLLQERLKLRRAMSTMGESA